MWERFFQPFPKEISAFRFNFSNMMPRNKVSVLFNRRQVIKDLSNRWPELQPQKVSINRPEMLPLESLKGSNAEYQIGFARKPGLPMPHFPISHSAICFYEPQQKKFIVLGRQSPFALNIRNWNLTTRIDDEANYLTCGYNFDAIMTHAKFSGQEISQMIKEANQNINSAQLCDMKHSNCYSNSVYMMASALEQMAERKTPPSEEELQSMMKTISIAAQDHLSVGVLNNEIVIDKVTSAFEKVKKLCGTDQSFLDECIANLHHINPSVE